MEKVNENSIEFRYKTHGSKYFFTAEGKYAFGTAFLRPGDEVKEHLHPDETEIFYFLSGTPVFICGGEELRAKEGDVYKVAPNEKHYIKNDTQSPVKFNILKFKEV